LHVVGAGGRHAWIERPSRPTMTQAFCDFLGAEPIRDEDLFLAAVVGFGSFGLIHAVVFEAAPLYLLQLCIKQFDYPQVERASRPRDVTGLGLPDGDTVPFHFEVVLNPYRLGVGEGGAFVRTFSQRPATSPLPTLPVSEGQTLRTHDLVAIAGHVSDA